MSGILNQLNLNGTFFFQIVDFVLLLVFLRIFVWPPLIKAMEARRAHIQSELASAEAERQEAVRLRQEQEQGLADAKAQAQAIVDRGQRAASEQANQVLEEARAAAERMQKQIRQEIVREREAAIAALRNEVAELAIGAAGKLLRARLDEPADRRLVEEFIQTADQTEAGSVR